MPAGDNSAESHQRTGFRQIQLQLFGPVRDEAQSEINPGAVWHAELRADIVTRARIADDKAPQFEVGKQLWHPLVAEDFEIPPPL